MKLARHFRVIGRLDGTGGVRPGTVTISPDGFFRVRPLRRKRVYELTLSDVADMVCRRIIINEHLAKKRARTQVRGRRR